MIFALCCTTDLELGSRLCHRAREKPDSAQFLAKIPRGKLYDAFAEQLAVGAAVLGPYVDRSPFHIVLEHALPPLPWRIKVKGTNPTPLTIPGSIIHSLFSTS